MKNLITIFFICAITLSLTTPQADEKLSSDASSTSLKVTYESSDNERMSTKDKFELAYKSLKDKHDGYIQEVMKTTAFILLAIGWILTSDKSRVFIGGNVSAYYSLLFAILIMALIYTYAQYGSFYFTNERIKLLNELNYVDATYYDQYRIKVLQFIENIMQNLVLLTVLFIMIFSLSRNSGSEI